MKQWTVAPPEEGARLDKVLVGRSKASRQQVKRWLDAGVVRLNGRSVGIAKWVVHVGDRLTIEDGVATPEARERKASRRFLHVLYEDANLIAVDKLPGMLVVPEEGTTAPTVVDAVRAYLRRRYPGARGTYAKALHRLDKGTSGVVLLAKARSGEGVIQQFKRHSVRREYVALVHGAVARNDGTITLPLAKGRFGHGRKSAAMSEGKAAITHFSVEERYLCATLLNIQVETGRTHQIRVHLASMGHPLIGDALYGLPKEATRGRSFRVTCHMSHVTVLPSGRQALHATRLKLRHPVSGAVIDIHARLPKDLERLIDRLRG